MSADSISSLNSMSSIGSGMSSNALNPDGSKKKGKKNWVCSHKTQCAITMYSRQNLLPKCMIII